VARGLIDRWTPVLMANVLVLSVLVVLIFGRSIASTTFALGLLAIWLGCSVAAWESAAGRSLRLVEGVDSTKRLLAHGARQLLLIALSAVGCALALAIVYWWSGMRGPWLAMWGLMVMASSVGLLFGLIVTAVSRTWIATSLVLLSSFLSMLVLGGWLWPAPAPSVPIRFAMSAMPSRWAFESLLLMEGDAIPPMADNGTAPPELPIDLAEPYFPAATERMGTRADAMALGFMVVGLTVAAGFISLSSKRSP
jgi:hypothetical protein